MLNRLILPGLGEGITKATIAVWHVQPGEYVKESDSVVEVVTDKATFHVPAGVSGRIKEILVREGEEAPIGGTLALIEPGVKK